MLKLKKSLIYEQNCYVIPHFTLYKLLLALVDLFSTKNNIFSPLQTKGINFLLLRQTDIKSIRCVFICFQKATRITNWTSQKSHPKTVSIDHKTTSVLREVSNATLEKRYKLCKLPSNFSNERQLYVFISKMK